MTEKRFKCVSDYDWWGVIDTTGEIKGEYDNDCFSTYTVVDLLNELAEENMMLKGENAHYKLLLMSLKETAEKFCEISKVKK